MKSPDKISDQELRRLRDAIFGPASDHNWEACRDKWRSDFVWLLNHQPKGTK
jgi:hypothetical protein